MILSHTNCITIIYFCYELIWIDINVVLIHRFVRSIRRKYSFFSLNIFNRKKCFSGKSQKLSKIETLRLARNYIMALTEILRYNQSMSYLTLGRLLCSGLSHTTVNAIAFRLNVESRMLLKCDPNIDSIIQFYTNYSKDFKPIKITK